MKRAHWAGIVSVLFLVAIGCAAEEQTSEGKQEQRQEEQVTLSAQPVAESMPSLPPHLPDYPQVRLAGRVDADGSLSVSAQWFGPDEWNRVILGKVSAEQLRKAGKCFLTGDDLIGSGQVFVRATVCPDETGIVQLHIRGRHKDSSEWSEKKFLGQITQEMQERIGVWFFTLDAADSALIAYTPRRDTPSRRQITTESLPYGCSRFGTGWRAQECVSVCRDWERRGLSQPGCQ